MEWALHISSAKDLAARPSLENISRFSQSEFLAPTLQAALRLSRECFGDVEFTHCVFGNEFCEHLTPSRRALDEAIGAARELRLNFTLVTPFTGNHGIDALRPLFERLAVEDDVEVV